MFGDELLELWSHLCVACKGKLGLDPLLEGCQPDLLETLRCRSRERLVGEIGERSTAPEVESLTQELHGGPRATPSCPFCKPLEAMQVELVRLEADDVSGRAGLDQRLRTECLAELRDLALDLGDGRHRSGSGVEIVGESVDRDDAIDVEEQNREGSPLLWPAEANWAVFPDDLERAEDAELEHAAGTVTGR
jgi:hypothetical protein